MKQLLLAAGLVLLTGSMVLSGTAMADDDLREQQRESNQNRRERQADAIDEMDSDNKKEAAEAAHERNQDVRERQQDVNEERRD